MPKVAGRAEGKAVSDAVKAELRRSSGLVLGAAPCGAPRRCCHLGGLDSSDAVPIPEHTIDEILERVDLVALVGRHVELKKSGKSFKGRCPFHQEKSASFYVTPEMKRFKCFGCQAGGDAIAFVQRYLGKTFVDAVRDLAREAGVDLAAAEDPSARERQHLREVTDLALEHFKVAAVASDRGRGWRARRWRHAACREETAKSFGLGWAPEAWSRLADLAARPGTARVRHPGGPGPAAHPRGRRVRHVPRPADHPHPRPGRTGSGVRRPAAAWATRARSTSTRRSRGSTTRARRCTAWTGRATRSGERKAAVLVEGYFDVHRPAPGGRPARGGAVLHGADARAPDAAAAGGGAGAGAAARRRRGGPEGRGAAGAGRCSRQGRRRGWRSSRTARTRTPSPGARAQRRSGRCSTAAAPLSEHLFRTVLPGGAAGDVRAEDGGPGAARDPWWRSSRWGSLRSAFFSGLAAHSGLPGGGAGGRAEGQGPPPPPGSEAGSSGGAGAGWSGRWTGPRRRWAALFLTRPELIRGAAASQVLDEVTHPGLRAVLAQLLAGALGGGCARGGEPAPPGQLEAAQGLLPRDTQQLPEAFETLSRRLKLTRVKERLDHIARATALIVGAHELDEETKRLQEERGELLRLKRQLEAAPSPPPSGSL